MNETGYTGVRRELGVSSDRTFLLVKWLAKDPDFEGVGPATARKLSEAFGDELHKVLSEGDPEDLIGIVHLELAKILLATYREKIAEAEVIEWLGQRGFDTRLAFKVVGVWGDRSIERLRANPYLMLTFAGWELVDAAAAGIGVKRDDERRLIGAVEAVVYRRLEQKHTVTRRELVLQTVRHLLRAPAPLAQRAVEAAIADRAVLAEPAGLQPVGAAVMERFVADRIGSLRRRSKPSTLFRGSVSDKDVREALSQLEMDEGYSLTNEQREAVRMGMDAPISLLTGGAGVGKTAVLKALHLVLEQMGAQVVAIALTGRAAKRISELTGREAMTIASCLRSIRSGGLRLGADALVIVDEASMLDLPTAYRLFRLIPEHVRFLFVGDPYQLPPIGFGLTFHLWVETASLPMVTLTQVHRQMSGSAIPVIANAIRQGQVPCLDAYHGRETASRLSRCRATA
jgi:exodeoxyribonuclease V alpha subunit